MARAKFTCEFCGKRLTSIKGVKNHQSQTVECKKALAALIESFNITAYDSDENGRGTDEQPEADGAHLWGVHHHELEAYPEAPASPPRRGVTIEDVEDEYDQQYTGDSVRRFVESFPEDRNAGVPTSREKVQTKFEKLRDEMLELGGGEDRIWEPFDDQEDWELAEWLVKSVGQTSIDEFLKLPIVSIHDMPTEGLGMLTKFADKTSNCTLIP